MHKLVHLVITLALLSTASLSSGQDTDATVKHIVTFYQQMDANHKNWPQAKADRTEAGATVGEAMWQNEEGHTLVEVTNDTDSGPQLTQYMLDGEQLLFLFKTEHVLSDAPGAPWSVAEFRHYFSDGALIRSLYKRGTFKANESADMSKFKNNVVALDQVEGSYAVWLEQANSVIKRLQPRLKAPGGSKKSGLNQSEIRNFLHSTEGTIGWKPVKGDPTMYDFFKDGRVHIQGPDGEATMWEGKWTLEGNKLTIKNTDKKTSKTVEVTIDGDDLLLNDNRYKRDKL